MNLSIVGKTIAILRKERGLTQRDLADCLGISDKAVSKWERGICCPDISVLKSLSYILEADIEDILNSDEHKRPWMGVLYLDDSTDASVTVYDKPLVNYLVSMFLLAGIRDVLIIGNSPEISAEGIDIRIISKEEAVNLRFTAEKNLFVIYDNGFIYGPHLTRYFRRAMASQSGGITVITSVGSKGRYPVNAGTERKISVADSIADNQLFARPFVFIPADMVPETDINIGFSGIMKLKELFTVPMNRGMLCLEIDSYSDIYDLAGFVRLMEESSGERIADCNEIARRRKESSQTIV